MALIGLDFDNTIVRYDQLFHQIATEKGLIDSSIPVDKTCIRNHLRKQGLDEQFTLLQGTVYGGRILEAKPAEGMLETLDYLNKHGHSMLLISHKTRHPFKGPAYDLHQSAIKWLTKYSFFSESFLNWNMTQVYFEQTKTSKLERIKETRCEYYIDDLPEIIDNIESLPKMRAILYDPGKNHSGLSCKRMNSWTELKQIVQ